jgi:glycosyltransferase involved in cell wall biosynthesis
LRTLEREPIRPAAAHENAGVTVVVPAYNEERGIRGVLTELRGIAKAAGYPFEILVVDDGSSDRTAGILAEEQGIDTVPVKVLRNDGNRGYGYSLKTGIRDASHPIVVITDADGTYPNDRIPELVAKVRAGAAMAVGARSLGSGSIPISRRPAKLVLNTLSNFLAGRRVPDYNSGLRAMRKDLVSRFEPILPDGFSFTTTITLAALTNGFAVEFVPIEYGKREGKSKIRPIRDTANFFNLIVRTVLYFRPLKVFVPIALALYLASFYVAFDDLNRNSWRLTGHKNDVIGDVAVFLFLSGVQVLVTGFLADLASDAFRQESVRRGSRHRVQLYENPLGFFMLATAFLIVVSGALYFWDKVIWERPLKPKTLAVLVTTLQFFTTGLLADLIQRRGRLK